jgi:hypothetical protein
MKMHICNMDNDFVNAKPCRPIIEINTLAMSKILKPNLSTIGPNNSDPINIPMGSMETSLPVLISSSLNFSVTAGRIDPNVINVIPNRKSAMQAAAKTWFRLYIRFIF